MFRPVNSKVDFPEQEKKTLQWWEDNDIVQRYMQRNESSDRRFSFIDGPITANNPMGVHHAWGRSYKDLFQRYKTMLGYRQRYQNGFDGQGLWIEVEVEKELNFGSKRDIEAFGIDKFVELCKERVRRFSKVQTDQSVRLGYWMDWDNSYHTMSDENNYTIWHFLKRCHEEGLIYEGTDVMPWCPRCGTGLSQHEIVTEGYQEVVHPGLFVRLPLLDRENESILIWTTTPWTLPGNMAAAVHPDLRYLKVQAGDEVLYVAKACKSVIRGEHTILEEMPGKELVGLRYRGPFDELPVQDGSVHRVVEWDEVTETEGTGFVHVAPGSGQEDFALGNDLGLPALAPLDEHGDFMDGFGWLTGMNVYEVNDPIYADLREKGTLYHLEEYSHRYPFCWRCGSELVFRLVDEWFISMDGLRDRISDVTRRIKWVPGFGMERELDWLRNMSDWMISKKRYWGLALPIYKCDCGHFEVIGSENELKERAVEGWDSFEGHSPHRPWIDAVRIECRQCGASVPRIKDVGNPWLDAGIVTFSTLGYRHDKEYWADWYPADWISESFPGQFRNWFYSLLTMSTVLEDREPCRSIFSYAIMRDENGEEMHKSKGNSIMFEEAADRMGVDTMRWMYARQNPAANLNFGYGIADDVRRKFIIPLWNVYSFFVTYANIDQFSPESTAGLPPFAKRPELDRWIISELNALTQDVRASLDDLEPESAARAAEDFVERLSNWYVRRSRRRFWKAGVVGGSNGTADSDKLSAYHTLYECLVTLTKLLAPIIPFLAEEMYQNLVRSTGNGEESVHLESYPAEDSSRIDERLADATRLAMRLSSLGRAARSQASLKVRQPLSRAVVKVRDQRESDMLHGIAVQIRDEINVKELATAGDESEMLSYEVRPNLSMLGPKYGREVRDITTAIGGLDAAEVYAAVSEGRTVQAGEYALEPEELLVETSDRPGYSVSSEAGYMVAVETEVTVELAAEGLAREVVHRIQNMRRSAGFDIADRIVTYYRGSGALCDVMEKHGEYVRGETLSERLVEGLPSGNCYEETHTIDGEEAVLGVVRT